MTKAKKIELPIIEPLYSTYHYQGPATASIVSNPSIRNFYLNQIMLLTCTRKFLNGFTTPEITVSSSSWNQSPYLDKKHFDMKFLQGHTNFVIRKLIDEGYYVCFDIIDDYYIEGKTWHGIRHFDHDGCICGYNQDDKTFCIYAYNKNWVYQKFWTPQSSFEKGRISMFKNNMYGFICGIKPKNDIVAFSYECALKKIAEYLDSSIEKYPETNEGLVYGTAVHDYIARYVGKLYDGSIPYERMDRRVFRMIWEHKKAMLERIEAIERSLHLDSSTSEAYRDVVREADNCRMLYAAHHMKQRNSTLPLIQKKLMTLKERERAILKTLIEKSKGGTKK